MNPAAAVPTLVAEGSDEPFALGQSLAIIDYLDAMHPRATPHPRERDGPGARS